MILDGPFSSFGRLVSLLLWAVLWGCYGSVADAFNVNSTGGSFPVNVYADATFAYQFTQSRDFVTYFGGGSSVGKCNIMGYWNPGNTEVAAVSDRTKVVDGLICTDACTLTNACGAVNTVPRQGATTRSPLVDYAGSDSVLGAADYASFPDLQMFPALAGAVVPVYNIPVLPRNQTLVLSRSTIARIFMGKIRYWNDTAILADNAAFPRVANVMQKVGQPIKVVLRTDSSGTTEIFSTALASFDPSGWSSFARVAGKGPTPQWCGPLTDEISVISVQGCSGVVGSKAMTFQVVYANSSGPALPTTVTFNCDASAATASAAFNTPAAATYNLTVIVNKYGANFSVGLADVRTMGRNWYKPVLVSAPPAGVMVGVSTLQEGGYLNSHYNSTYMVTPLTVSLWVQPTGASQPFYIQWKGGSTGNTGNSLDSNNSPDLSQVLYAALNKVRSVASSGPSPRVLLLLLLLCVHRHLTRFAMFCPGASWYGRVGGVREPRATWGVGGVPHRDDAHGGDDVLRGVPGQPSQRGDVHVDGLQQLPVVLRRVAPDWLRRERAVHVLPAAPGLRAVVLLHRQHQPGRDR